MNSSTLLARRARALALAMAALVGVQAIPARAGIVDTQTLTAPGQADEDRAKILSFIERANLAQRLKAMGLDGLNARDRVAALSEAEVHALAQQIDTLPAGGALSFNDMVIILLVAILVAIAL